MHFAVVLHHYLYSLHPMTQPILHLILSSYTLGRLTDPIFSNIFYYSINKPLPKCQFERSNKNWGQKKKKRKIFLCIERTEKSTFNYLTTRIRFDLNDLNGTKVNSREEKRKKNKTKNYIDIIIIIIICTCTYILI